MKKVLIIANEYYPNPSAITNCFSPIIEEMKNQGFLVDILTKKQTINMEREEIIDNVHVYRVEDWFYNSYEMTNLQKEYVGYFFMKWINKVNLYTFKAARFLDYHINRHLLKNQDGFLNKKLTIKLGKKLNQEKKYDIIISLSYPFLTHEIAYNIVKNSPNKIKWYAYQFDPNTNNYTLDDKHKNRRMKKEIKILENAERIFLPQENYEENINCGLIVLKEKYIPFPYAAINNRKSNKAKKKSEELIFVFTGTLYERIRNPQNVLDFFVKLFEKGEMKFKVYFYYRTVTTIENMLQRYKEKLGATLLLYPNSNKEECDKALEEADILINIGNSVPNQTPSKIFENISMCKPIVNFYSIDKDTSKRQLEKYPLSFNIDGRNEISEDLMQNFILFCNQSKEINITFEEATKKFLKADEVAKEFVKIVGE